ncbi:MAG TPA: hypothetical protein VND92_11725 [Vicinamibacterales bacterium]|nr:hypothetical protein [Vicinamibacterales bacterium]
MTQQELDRAGTDAVYELDLDFHLDSAREDGRTVHYNYSNRHAVAGEQHFEIDVDLDRVGPSPRAVKAYLRHEIEFAGHHHQHH